MKPQRLYSLEEAEQRGCLYYARVGDGTMCSGCYGSTQFRAIYRAVRGFRQHIAIALTNELRK